MLKTFHYSGPENKHNLPLTPPKRFWRWSQRFTDNPHLKQKTGLQEQDIELTEHTPHHYEGNTRLQSDTEAVKL